MQGWSSRFFAPNKGVDLLNPFVGYWAGSGDYGETAANIQTLVDISGNGRNASQATASLQPQFTPDEIPYFLLMNHQVVPLPITPADMNGRDWSVYFRVMNTGGGSSMEPVFSGGVNAANQAFSVLLYGSNPSYAQHTTGYTISSKTVSVNAYSDILFTHTVSGQNIIYVDDGVNSSSYVALNIGASSITLGKWNLQTTWGVAYKINRFAFWQRIVTADEFARLRMEE